MTALDPTIDPAVLYDELTDGRTRSVRLDALLYAAAERHPGLVPSEAEMVQERGRKLSDKTRVEFRQGLLASAWLSLPEHGAHLLRSMLEPLPEAVALLPELARSGELQIGPVHVTRRGRAGILELSNPRHLNAEDDQTLADTEVAVDLILLDPEIEVGVFRGGVVEHPRYAGRRVLGSGINLTRLYLGMIDFLFYLTRDLGYVNKMFRGLEGPHGPREKLWIGVCEVFAIGGHAQMLHTVDHVIATRGAKLYLPARKEGIIPGASNLRLPRFVGDRAARQAILSGREWTAGEPGAELLVDEVVEEAAVDGALAARIDALTNSGLINAIANRRMLRIAQEPLELYREYMAVYAREQAGCHLSPALVANLERHWNASSRRI